MRFLLFLSLVILACAGLKARPDSVRNGRKTGTAAVLLTGYTAAMTGLYHCWYDDYPQTSFHFFDDNREWLQADKAGHLLTAYAAGKLAYHAFRRSGHPDNRSLWMGAGSAWLFLGTVEIFDGFSSQWGFSWGDMVANTLGSGILIGQQRLWGEQRLELKVSRHTTGLADLRPDLLGKAPLEQAIKDYNGMTFWISGNPRSFLQEKGWIPGWLNLAAGYGAYGMLGGFRNPAFHDGRAMPVQDRYRRFFLGPDIRFTRIRTKSRTLSALFELLDLVRLPLPALEYNRRQGVTLHPFYF